MKTNFDQNKFWFEKKPQKFRQKNKFLVEKIFDQNKILGPYPQFMVRKRIQWAQNIILEPKTGNLDPQTSNLGSKLLPDHRTTLSLPLALPSHCPTYSFVPPDPPTHPLAYSLHPSPNAFPFPFPFFP